MEVFQLSSPSLLSIHTRTLSHCFIFNNIFSAKTAETLTDLLVLQDLITDKNDKVFALHLFTLHDQINGIIYM